MRSSRKKKKWARGERASLRGEMLADAAVCPSDTAPGRNLPGVVDVEAQCRASLRPAAEATLSPSPLLGE